MTGEVTNPHLSPASTPPPVPTPEGAGKPDGGYPTSEIQPSDLAMLSGMYGGMYGGYGGMYPGMGMGMGFGYPGGLGNYNTGMMTGNYITPSASPVQKQAVRAEIAEAAHSGLREYRKEWASIGAVIGAVLGGVVGFKSGGFKGGMQGAALGSATLGGTGFFVGEAYGENRAPKDAVYNDYLNDATMGTYSQGH